MKHYSGYLDNYDTSGSKFTGKSYLNNQVYELNEIGQFVEETGGTPSK